MWKNTLLCVLLCSTYAAATELKPLSVADVETMKQQWLAEHQRSQQKLATDRANFLQLEALLKNAERQGKLSPAVFALAERLKSADYPLQSETDWLLFKGRLAVDNLSPEQLEQAVWQFADKYPTLAKRNQLLQLPYQHYYQAQKLPELIAYSEKVPPTTIANQCRVFAAKFQLFAEKLAINPEAEQAGSPSPSSAEMAKLLTQFDQFWLGKAPTALTDEQSYWRKQGTLPSECHGIEAYWRDQGLKTTTAIRQKALYLFDLGAKQGLAGLKEQSADPELTDWLTAVTKLLDDPKTLQDFVQYQPLVDDNRQLIENVFPQFVRTLAEQLDKPTFSIYQAWADKWSISEQAQRNWRIAFIRSLFDNPDPTFQAWRDTQLLELKEDGLTDRRLRMAILQKSPLKPWLANLTAESRAKAEWRYWRAKSEPSKREKELEALAAERGFYPMLAAQALGKPYRLNLPPVPSLTTEQQAQFAAQLARIAELRALNRLGAAKTAWVDLMQAVSFEEKLALSQYAHQQDWFDLTVEGTIQAKAWDYLQLRLPNAYSDWFDLHLSDKNLSKTFAMAITRQESAWNSEARSHANALGLMQMLVSTAKQTADHFALPFTERDLLDPFKNIMLGTAHLAELNEKYPNNRILIAAAYNAGPHRVKKWLERANGRLEMDEFIATIPFVETRGYVQNVLAYDYYYQVLQNQPEKQMFHPAEQRRY